MSTIRHSLLRLKKKKKQTITNILEVFTGLLIIEPIFLPKSRYYPIIENSVSQIFWLQEKFTKTPESFCLCGCLTC